jgi:hypothetical protein
MPIVPLAELPREYKLNARQECERLILEKMKDSGIIKNYSEAVVRDLVPGDPTASNVTDFVDITFKTAQTTGQEFWAEDSSDITAGDLSSILTAGETVPDNKVIGFFGFFDLTPGGSDLTAIRFKRGDSGVLDFWEVEQCYAYSDEIGGMAFRYDPEDGTYKPYAIIYGQNDKIEIEMNFKTSADKFVGLFALIGEKVGETIAASP